MSGGVRVSTKEKTCKYCGQKFVGPGKDFCCPEHCKLARKDRVKASSTLDSKEVRKKRKSADNSPLMQIVRKADAMGLSYGVYVQRYGE